MLYLSLSDKFKHTQSHFKAKNVSYTLNIKQKLKAFRQRHQINNPTLFRQSKKSKGDIDMLATSIENQTK